MMNLEEVLTVHVRIDSAVDLKGDNCDTIVMICFSGSVTGKYFSGEVLPGGVDTQIIGRFGDRHTLSARYMLEGKDFTGEPCKIFIENNGNINKEEKEYLFRTYPKINTNSKALDFLNHSLLIGEGWPTEAGVDIKIYRAE